MRGCSENTGWREQMLLEINADNGRPKEFLLNELITRRLRPRATAVLPAFGIL